ncbi:hypothetical protein LEP1GSC172_3777 [Leptospira noguchii]|nr:hypothetical protein LEP1GSC172_3777 [Leptospira noguchii]
MFLPLKNKMFLIFQFSYPQSDVSFQKNLQYERNRGELPVRIVSKRKIRSM